MKKKDVETKKELNADEILDSFYRQTGYSEVELYKEPDYDIMNYNGKSKYYTDFNYINDFFIDEIKKTIIQSSAFQRLAHKSMNTKLGESESHIQTRQTHVIEVSELARIISTAIGTNSKYAEVMALAHDIGHTPHGHPGERMMSSIARFNNCGYMIHPAIGAYILERERITEHAFKSIKRFYPKLSQQQVDKYKELIRYVVDGIISHNGEGTVGKIIPINKDIQRMRDEIRRCFTVKEYDKKLLPGTMEGAIIRYADIIAYTRSDLVDGFRLLDENNEKIMTEFNDEYLALIGTVIARKNNFNKLLTLEQKFLTEIYGLSEKIKNLEEKDYKYKDTKEIERTKKEREIIKAKYDELCKFKIEYAEGFIKKIKPKSDVKTIIPQMMQDTFLKDLIETSRDNDGITMSPLMRRTLFALRELNGKYIIPYTARDYEKDLPQATKELIDSFKNSLIKSGIVFDAIPAKERGNYKLSNNKGYSINNDKYFKDDFDKKMFHYYNTLFEKKEKRDEIYYNCINALKDITYHDVRIAAGIEQYNGDLKELYEEEKIKPIREKIEQIGDIAKTKRGIKKLADELFNERIENIEESLASKLAIEYVCGMTDNTLENLLEEKNIISKDRKKVRPAKKEKAKREDDGNIKILKENFKEDKYANLIIPDSDDERKELEEHGL